MHNHTQVVTYTQPFTYAVPRFCKRSPNWLENISTEFDEAVYYFHADSSFRLGGTSKCFDLPASIPGEDFAAL